MLTFVRNDYQKITDAVTSSGNIHIKISLYWEWTVIERLENGEMNTNDSLNMMKFKS